MVNTDTSDWKTKIDALIDGEVKCIGMWMWGDVKKNFLKKKNSLKQNKKRGGGR